ncbi:hypothetical protein B0T22DRAFT_466975 [Podospora appendiculata]|uniref:ubiquitinyl hydrolase 1 n=1 Tax=Podospora appendiculata TaxID=314037 RepID=A0AAE1CAV7_9PEZI|nr:hypothetical protein B0T22DRAFT_466975 [Podospora appendiculata]
MMNSDIKRIQRQFDSYNHNHHPNAQHPPYSYYSPDRLWDRISDPTTLVPTILFALALAYHAASQRAPLPPLHSVLWYCLVAIIPAGLLYAVDHWLNPPLFPLPMLTPQSRSHAAKSDVLRRMLGLDKPGSLMMSVSSAGRRSMSSISNAAMGLKLVTDRPPGLGNYDNSCYQNSILQGLSALKTFPNYLSGIAAEGSRDRPAARTADALLDLIAQLNDPSNNGTTLWTPGILKNMSTWQQQDAQEYFSKLLEEIDKEIAKGARAPQRLPSFENDSARDDTSSSQHSDDSGYQSLVSTHPKVGTEVRLAQNPLEGLIAQRVACVACGYCEGLSMIPFNCITLNLGINQAQHDIFERLDHYTRVESIQGVQCSRCSLLRVQKLIRAIVQKSRDLGKPEAQLASFLDRLTAIDEALEDEAFDDESLAKKCKITSQQRVNSTKTKQTVIARAPQSLVVHMNRSVFDENTGHMFKNLAAVRFPMELDLGPWCLGSASGRMNNEANKTDSNDAAAEDEQHDAHDQEQWLVDPRSSMVAAALEPSNIKGPLYELRAVITHYGRHENGHYVCYRRHPENLPQDKEDGVDAEKPPPQLASEGPVTESPELVEEEAALSENPVTDERRSQWWRLSDQDVTRVDEEIVLAQGGVFMLFYDCIQPHPVPSLETDEFVKVPPGMVELYEEQENQAVEARDVVGAAEALDEFLTTAVAVPLPADEDEDEGSMSGVS